MNEEARRHLAWAAFAFGQAVRSQTPERVAYWVDQFDAALAAHDRCLTTPAPDEPQATEPASDTRPHRLRWWQRLLRLGPIAGFEVLP